MTKTILVTGAAGFIGSHLAEALLLKGHRVVGIDNFDPFYHKSIKEGNLKTALANPNFSFIAGDANDRGVLDGIDEKIDVVVHLAAKAGVLPSLRDPKAYIKVNIELTNTILEWMKDRKMNKLVFASSSSVYGNAAKIPFGEDDIVNEPISPYAFTKRSCELMNYAYHSLYHIDIVNLRFFTVYGERQRPDLAIHKFVRNIINGEPITLYGDGSTARDYTYFADTVQGISAAIHYISERDGVWETFNLGNHKPVTLLALIKTIEEVSGVKPVLKFEEMKPGDVNITYASVEKAGDLLGYRPSVSLKTGLTNFIEWFRAQEAALTNQ